MQDLTLSQEYLLCTLTEKGRLPVMNTAGPVCLTAGALRAGAAVEEKGGLLGGKTCYVPQRAAVDAVIEKLRAEILEDGEATEDAAALASLLGAAGTLKNYFSRYEQKQIKDKLRAITQAPAGKMVREMVEALENMIAVMTAVIAVT